MGTNDKVKTRTWSGAVLEQEVYPMPRKAKAKTYRPRPPRFKSEEERKAHYERMSRKRHRQLVNANFTPKSVYSTLTFSGEYECHTFEEARQARDLYFRRLRRACPNAGIMIYMGRGGVRGRIHFHMLTDGVPVETISGKWGYGLVQSQQLRASNTYNGIDCGQDYTGLADYLFNHWTEEQGGHRWKATRNLKEPEREEPTPVKRNYSPEHPPRAPKGYKLVETYATEWGYQYFKYILEKPKCARKGALNAL